MSTLEVDKIIPQSGTETQLGESGDTITIPSGATITNNGTATGFGSADTEKVKVSANDTTAGFLNGKLVAGTNISLTEGSDGGNETLTAALSGTITPSDNTVTLAKMAPGTDGNIISYDASGNPVAVATGNDGQVLTSAGAGAPPVFETLPVGGITATSHWKPSATTSGAYTNITSWTQDVSMGASMSHSSGVFTFPSTGFWLITWFCTFNVNASTDYVKLRIRTTTDNSNYNAPSFIYQGIDSGDTAHASGTLNYLFDVTNTSTHKVAFGSAEVQTGTLTMLGGAGTKATFLRVGDT